MRRSLSLVLLLLGGVLAVWGPPPSASAAGEYVALITIDGQIDRLSSGYLARSIDDAEDGGASLLIVRLDTPGGLLSSTRDMVMALLSAEVPVAVYVSPAGARAASAGTFIAAAANFAVMAPGTNIGAASPVASGGQDIPATLAKKINEDTAAFIRSIAAERGRNAKALEETVTLARSYSAAEALELNIVDFTASDLRDLLGQLDGRAVETAAGAAVLNTNGLEIREVKHTFLENFLGVIANPNLAFVLLVIGGLGIVAEVMSPGLIGPGVIGVIALALAFLGFGNLSVNWAGVGLILFSMVLFYLETAQPGASVFGIGGLVSFVLGALLLFGRFFSAPDIPEPSRLVSTWIIGAFSGTFAGALLMFIRFARTEGGKSSGYITAEEGALEGEWGEVVSDLAPSGRVWVANEEWIATTDTGDVIRKGEEVLVVGVYGNILKVTRYNEQPQPEDAT